MIELTMPPIREAFGQEASSPWSSPCGATPAAYDDRFYCDYEDMVKAMGVTLVFHLADHDYQGDSFMLLREPNSGAWGYLTFGWGSCSGCDSLQAALDQVRWGDDGWKALIELRDDLARSIHWETTAGALADWMENRPWDTLWEWSYKDTLKQFIPQAAGILREVQRAGTYKIVDPTKAD